MEYSTCGVTFLNLSSKQPTATTDKDAAVTTYQRGIQGALPRESLAFTAFAMDTIGIYEECGHALCGSCVA